MIKNGLIKLINQEVIMCWFSVWNSLQSWWRACSIRGWPSWVVAWAGTCTAVSHGCWFGCVISSENSERWHKLMHTRVQKMQRFAFSETLHLFSALALFPTPTLPPYEVEFLSTELVSLKANLASLAGGLCECYQLFLHCYSISCSILWLADFLQNYWVGGGKAEYITGDS